MKTQELLKRATLLLLNALDYAVETTDDPKTALADCIGITKGDLKDLGLEQFLYILDDDDSCDEDSDIDDYSDVDDDDDLFKDLFDDEDE